MASSDKSPKSSLELLQAFQKDFGEGVGKVGVDYEVLERIPTGIFQFDLASGGGFPRGRVHIIYGPESSGKTNVALKAIAQHQRRWPKLKCAFFDIENTLDPVWAKAMGVDTNNLLVFKPDFAEQAVDMIEALLRASDCGLIVLDSLAALVSTRELNQSAEKDNVGGSTLAIGKLMRKGTLALQDAEKAGLAPTLILINQTRFKVGFVLGNPETMPGGNAPKFAASMIVRVYGKNISLKKESPMPVRKNTHAVIGKWKCPILATHAQWEMVTTAYPGHKVGEIMNDEGKPTWNAAEKRLRNLGLMQQVGGKKGGWQIGDETLATITEWQKRFDEDEGFRDWCRDAILKAEFAAGEVQAEGDNETAVSESEG